MLRVKNKLQTASKYFTRHEKYDDMKTETECCLLDVNQFALRLLMGGRGH